MPDNYIKADYQDRILPGRLYRVEISLEVPLANLGNLDTMLNYFLNRVRSRSDLHSLSVTKGLITEEKAELFIFISFGRSEATKSLWTIWKVLEWQLSAIGVPKLINVDIQELPVELGQPETGLIESVQTFLNKWGVALELLLLLIIIFLLISDKKE